MEEEIATVAEDIVKRLLIQLNNNQVQTEKMKVQLQEEIMKKLELESEVDKEKRSTKETKILLEVAIKSSVRGEAERVSLREEAARHGIAVEALTRERNALAQTNRDLQIELNQVKRDLEQGQTQTVNLQTHHQSLKDKMNRSYAAFESLNNQVVKLEQECSRLKKMVDTVITFSLKALRKVNLQRKTVQEALQEKEKINRSLIQLSNELEELNEKCEDSKTSLYLQEQALLEDVKECSGKDESYEQKCCQLQSSLSASLASYSTLHNSHTHLKLLFNTLQENYEKVRTELKAAKEI